MATLTLNRAEASFEAFLAAEEAKDLLRFTTAGSVDDGKSTLIGRLLYDSRNVYEDQIGIGDEGFGRTECRARSIFRC